MPDTSSQPNQKQQANSAAALGSVTSGTTSENTNPQQGFASVSLPPNPSGQTQKLEIQIQSHPNAPSSGYEAKIVIPWIIAVIGWAFAGLFYFLNRKSKITDTFTDMVVGDVKDFLEKMEEISCAVASHQGACPCKGSSLKESRQHLTTLRRAAVAVSGRIENALVNGLDRDEWKNLFRQWKIDSEGETGWITNKNKKWSQTRTERLEKDNEKFIRQVTGFRNRIATRKIKIKA